MELSKRQEGEQEELASQAQTELEELHRQDAQVQKELEDIRVSHANVSQKFGFLEENIARIDRELERLEQEEETLIMQAGQEKEQADRKNRRSLRWSRKLQKPASGRSRKKPRWKNT